MAAALIALGSNLGDRQRILDDAIAQLAAHPGIHVVAKSRWHATWPIGGPPGQGEFLNGAALIETTLSPEQLHAALKQIEAAAGRNRAERWAPRTLDLDLLLYDELVIETAELTVPHPRMAFRRFVLEPAAEIAPAMRHPTIGWTMAALRDHLHGDWITNRWGTRYLAAIAGPIGAGKTALASIVADALGATLIKDPATPVSRDASPMVRAGRIFSWQVQSSEVRAKAITWFALMKCRSNAISDYWLEQSLCDAEMELPLDELSGYLDRFDAALAKAAKPNLLVFLDVLPEVSWKRIHERGPIPSWLNRDWLVRYRDVLLAKITAPKRGPLLRLDGTKLGEAKDELIVAIQAMQ